MKVGQCCESRGTSVPCMLHLEEPRNGLEVILLFMTCETMSNLITFCVLWRWAKSASQPTTSVCAINSQQETNKVSGPSDPCLVQYEKGKEGLCSMNCLRFLSIFPSRFVASV